MIRAAMGEAVTLLRTRPALWIPGLVLAFLIMVDLAVQVYGGTFLIGKLWILELILFPYFVAGALGTLKSPEPSSRQFLADGIRYYFRILLPLILIVCAILLTVFLVLVPLSLIGIPPTPVTITGILIGVGVPLGCFTIFYDNAAVFEDRRIFPSILRSIEVVANRPVATLKFIFASVVVAGVVMFFLFTLWAFLLADQITSLATMASGDLPTISPELLIDVLGPGGLLLTGILAAAGITLLIPFIITFKATVFRTVTGELTSLPMEGNYDSKGRWYKY